MNKKLTILQAFRAMQFFLDDYYYNITLSDDLGSLLGGLQLFPDGGTWDPAMWHDWIDAVGPHKNLTEVETLQAVHKFLEDYYLRGKSKDIKTIYNSLDQQPDGNFDQTVWQQWLHSIHKSLTIEYTIPTLYKP